jgi:acid phosphatase type 7
MKKVNIIIFFLLIILNLYGQNLSSAKFFVCGDTQSGHKYHREIIGQMAKEKKGCGFILNTGDLVAYGFLQWQWDTFLDIIKPVNEGNMNPPAYLAVVGNHDIMFNSNSDSKRKKNLNWLPGNGEFYKYDYRNIRLIILNSCSKETFQEQTDSLTSWLKSNHSKWIIVAWHHPAYSFSSHSGNSRILKSWWPLLYKYKVDLIFNGHAHHYARTYPIKPVSENPFGKRDNDHGVVQIINGGGGGSLIPIKKNKKNKMYFDNLLAASNDKKHHYCEVTATDSELILEAKDTKGNTFDRLVLKK